nr:hypothetical protein Iba_chr02bCG2300 [Ipomoea batatas]
MAYECKCKVDCSKINRIGKFERCELFCHHFAVEIRRSGRAGGKSEGNEWCEGVKRRQFKLKPREGRTKARCKTHLKRSDFRIYETCTLTHLFFHRMGGRNQSNVAMWLEKYVESAKRVVYRGKISSRIQME